MSNASADGKPVGFMEGIYNSIFKLDAAAGDRTEFISDVKVYGLPLAYNNLADPAGRVFRKTILKRMPVVSIQPGIAKASLNKDTDPDGSKEKAVAARLAQVDAWCKQGGDPGDKEVKASLAAAYHAMKDDSGSFPYLLFTKADKEYEKAYTTLASRVFSRIDLMISGSRNEAQSWGGGLFEEFKKSLMTDISPSWSSNGWINFYMDKASAFNESGANTYDQSMFAGLAKKITGVSQEIQSLFGGNGTNETNGGAGAGMFSKLGDALGGNQVVFPKVWQDSTFSRSYQLAFRFESPYGDPMSIFRHVYMPFLMLLAMALPRQTGISSYKAPFMVRVDCPGWFTIDCGIIGNISIRKGEAGWTESGLPLSIDINMDIEDIYPQLIIANNPAILNMNFSLAAYIDSMTGISYVETLTGGSLKHGIRSLLAATAAKPRALLNSVGNDAVEGVQNFSGWLASWL
jgi:hypothetical protein